MSAIEKYKQFMAQVDWGELSAGEKEALYEATYGAPNPKGIPFKVISDGGKYSGATIIYEKGENYKPTIDLSHEELIDFRSWLENNYMHGNAEAYFAIKKEQERRYSEERRHTNMWIPKRHIYRFDLENSVLQTLQKYRSSFRIARDVQFAGEMRNLRADFVVYDVSLKKVQLVLEVDDYLKISQNTFIAYSKQIASDFDGAPFLFTDSKDAYFIENKKLRTIPLRSALDQFLPTEEVALTDTNIIKNYLREIISTTRTQSGKEKVKAQKLTSFIDGLQDNDIVRNAEDHNIIHLTNKKEGEFFQTLLGDSTDESIDTIVKFSSMRSLKILADEKTINMCSLICMNDPGEKDYADRIFGKQDTIDNYINTYIISACAEEKESDLTMWRLYADDAQGVCMRFAVDKNKLNKNGFYLSRVFYADPDEKYFEVEVVKKLLNGSRGEKWSFRLEQWRAWKHFFKNPIYAVEDEIRLLYIPEEGKEHNSKWVIDDRTGIYSEMMLFDLSKDSEFPLSISKITLGVRCARNGDNAKQFHRRLKNSGIRFNVNADEDIVIPSTIGDYQ